MFKLPWFNTNKKDAKKEDGKDDVNTPGVARAGQNSASGADGAPGNTKQKQGETDTAQSLNELLASLRPGMYYQATPPASSEQMDALLARFPLPRRNPGASLRELYRITGDTEIGPNIFLLSPQVILDSYEANYAEFLDADMPSLFLFAVDHQSRAYFCDTDGSMGRNVGAIYVCDLACLLSADCILCAPSLTDFLRLTTAGQRPWLDPNYYS